MHFIKNPSNDIIDQLVLSFANLTNSAKAIRFTALKEKDEYEAFAPSYGNSLSEQTSDQARIAILNKITKIFRPAKNEEPLLSGMLCASDELVKKINMFNRSKEEFIYFVSKSQRYAEKSLRENSGRFISNLMKKEVISHFDGDIFDLQTLEQIFCNQIDLLSCRAKIKVLPKNLRSFSWTWTSKHRSIQKISKSQAVQLTSKLEGDSKASALQILSACPDEFFAKVKPLKEQLRANYVYFENNLPVQKSTPVSGVVIAPQRKLPMLMWRDPPSSTKKPNVRLQRPTTIEETPILPALKIHRYL